MSVKKLELKEEHVKLLRQFDWSMKDGVVSGIGNDGEDYLPPFKGNTLHEEIDLILNGTKSAGIMDETSHVVAFTEETMAEWDKLYKELPMALDIVLFNGHFELGTYITKFHLRKWKKIN